MKRSNKRQFFVPSNIDGVWKHYNKDDSLKRTAGTCKMQDKLQQPCVIGTKYQLADIKRVTMTNGNMTGYIGNIRMFKEDGTTLWRAA